jgi:transposase-like protein
MYIPGTATRKVSTQVSACAKLLDAELQRWRDRSSVPSPYLILDARSEQVRQNGQLLVYAVLADTRYGNHYHELLVSPAKV